MTKISEKIRTMIREEVFSTLESKGAGLERPPQVTDQILPGGKVQSKIYGGSTLDLDVDGHPNNPKKLKTRDSYSQAREEGQHETAAISRTGIGLNMSEGLQYHLQNHVTLDDNVYRPGTKEFFSLFNEAKELWRLGLYEANEEEYEIFQSDIGEWVQFEGKMVPLDFPMWDDENVSEAKYKGKEVRLGAAGATRTGGRAHVYVRDPKTGNVKKVSFGSSMPDAMGDSPAAKARRKSFAARHNCAGKKDKTKPGYWACRSTKMFGRNVPGWW